jgi:hypothetical protein
LLKPLATRRRTLAALLLTGSLLAVSACAALPQQPVADPSVTPSSSQAADGPLTAA